MTEQEQCGELCSLYVSFVHVSPKFLPIMNQSVLNTEVLPKGVEAIPLRYLSPVSGCGLMEWPGLLRQAFCSSASRGCFHALTLDPTKELELPAVLHSSEIISVETRTDKERSTCCAPLLRCYCRSCDAELRRGWRCRGTNKYE